MAKKLVLISLDALQQNDLETLFARPYIKSMKEKFAVVENLREVYPTLTYPIHATIVTGVKPKDHGIVHNQINAIHRDAGGDWSIMGADWYWYKHYMKVPTLADAFWNDGRTVASVNWPVTAGDMRGTNCPEIWPVPVLGEDARTIYNRAASPDFMEKYYDKYIDTYDWVGSGNADLHHYGVENAIEILREEKPDLIMVHVVHLDHIRHVFGDSGAEVNEAMRVLDSAVGRLVEATKIAGTYEDTNFVILGDHGQIDIDRECNLNAKFVDLGLITLGLDNKPVDYVAYGFSAGFSTHIYLKDSSNEADKERVYGILCAIRDQYPQYIDKVYTAKEIEESEGLSGAFSFVVEPQAGTLITNNLLDPFIVERGSSIFKGYGATHGYHPDKGFKPPLFAFGPDIEAGVTIKNGDMLQICPTLAKLAGLEMPQATAPVLEIFKTKE